MLPKVKPRCSLSRYVIKSRPICAEIIMGLVISFAKDKTTHSLLPTLLKPT